MRSGRGTRVHGDSMSRPAGLNRSGALLDPNTVAFLAVGMELRGDWTERSRG